MNARAHFAGRLTADPEIKTFANTGDRRNNRVARFSVAINEAWLSCDGQRVEKTHFFDFEAFGSVAEWCEKWLKKGARVGLWAQPRQDTWEDKEGGQRSRVVFRLDGFPALYDWPETEGQKRQAAGREAAPIPAGTADEEIPF